jgi:hypothetical protein
MLQIKFVIAIDGDDAIHQRGKARRRPGPLLDLRGGTVELSPHSAERRRLRLAF